jgi:SNF2 family DNA or RNA helicase
MGIDGLQKVCSVGFFVEEDWRPGMADQAEDRLCRMGQKESVLIIHFCFDGSLDANMMHRLVEKQDVIDSAVNSVKPVLKERKIN